MAFSFKDTIGSSVFWRGLMGILGIILVAFALMNFVILPLYTKHGSELTVPNVTKQNKEQAIATLAASGLEVHIVDNFHNAAMAPNVVMEQRPIAGVRVKPGRQVTLFVNNPKQEFVKIPSLVSLSERQAELKLQELGLALGKVKNDTSSSLPKGNIVRQSPAGGNDVKRGTTVDLWVSLGFDEKNAMRTVPDLFGRSVTEITSLLGKLDLQLEIKFGGESGNPDAQCVIRQSPSPGAAVKKNTKITVSVGSECGVYEEPEESFEEEIPFEEEPIDG
jgi:eukaryotic-like serine/threonine-protein kinase